MKKNFLAKPRFEPVTTEFPQYDDLTIQPQSQFAIYAVIQIYELRKKTIIFKLFWRSYQQILADKSSIDAFYKGQLRFQNRWHAEFCRISINSDIPGKLVKEFKEKLKIPALFQYYLKLSKWILGCLIVMYKLPLLKIVEKTVDFGAFSIPF